MFPFDIIGNKPNHKEILLEFTLGKWDNLYEHKVKGLLSRSFLINECDRVNHVEFYSSLLS